MENFNVIVSSNSVKQDKSEGKIVIDSPVRIVIELSKQAQGLTSVSADATVTIYRDPEGKIAKIDIIFKYPLSVEEDINSVVMRSDKEAKKAYEEGKYVLVCDGKFIGAYDTEEEAIKHAKGYEHCTIGNKNYPKVIEGELV